jgi:uncharacterized protein (TIRG00374 family)
VNKTFLWTALKYLLAGAVLSYVVYANWEPEGGRGLGDVWQRHIVEREPINGAFLLFAFVIHAAGLMTTLVRWYLLVRAQDMPFTLLSAFRLGTLGFLFSAFLPGSVGGDVVKAATLARGQSRQTVAIATVIMDRLMSLWALIFLVAGVGTTFWIAHILDGHALAASIPVIVGADVISGVLLTIWIVMGLFSLERTDRFALRLQRLPRIGGPLAQLWHVVWLYRSRPASIGWAVVLSTFSNVCDILAFYFYVLTFWDALPANPLPSFAAHFIIMPIGLIISAIPLFPGGAGIGEAGYGGLYELFDAAPANGILSSLLFRVSGWVIGILGYVICAAIDPERGTPQSQSPSEI